MIFRQNEVASINGQKSGNGSVSEMTDFPPITRLFKVSGARPIILAKLDVPLDLVSAKKRYTI